MGSQTDWQKEASTDGWMEKYGPKNVDYSWRKIVICLLEHILLLSRFHDEELIYVSESTQRQRGFDKFPVNPICYD